MLFSEEEAKNEGSVKDKFANDYFPRSGQRASASDMFHRERVLKCSPFSPDPLPTSTLSSPPLPSSRGFLRSGRREFSSQTEDF